MRLRRAPGCAAKGCAPCPRRWRHAGTARSWLLAGLVAALGATGLAAPDASAQELPGLSAAEEAAPAADPIRAEPVAERRSALAEELAAAQEALAAERDATLRAHHERRSEQLRRIGALLERQAELLASDPEPQPPTTPGDAPPSVFALNQLYEAEAEREARDGERTAALAASREALAKAKDKLDEAERERRLAKGELEEISDAAARAPAARALELSQLASRAARERVHLRTLETRLAQRRLEAGEAAPALEGRIDRLREALARGEGESGAGLAALARLEGELGLERQRVERKLATIELRLDAAQQRFSREADAPGKRLEEVEALTAQRDAIRQELALLEERSEHLATRREVWRQWQALLRGEGSREELEAWKEATAERIEAFRQAQHQRRGQAADLERRLEALEERLAGPAEGRLRPLLEEQAAALARLLEVERTGAAELAGDLRLSERLLADLRSRTGDVDPMEYAARGIQAFRDLWSYEITAVEDSPITVGSLVLALLLAGAGLWASRRGSALVGRLATVRFKLDAGAAHALQTLSFYVLLVSFTLLALRAIHFPLTAFTVLGGALAIGIGFGSQNVMNNFISGLILMLERPVRAGDIVEVDGNHGSIERIGARSTQIRSTDGRHIVVPNSFFLESNVVNWTLSDDLIRTRVLVGVIYGSPTRLVEQLIRQVVAEEERVLDTPEPVLLFDEFGDNSLNFEVHFWVRARSPMETRKVQSLVRFRIDDLFREHDLVIAFPQRDVHLDSVSPIEVRMIDATATPQTKESG